MRGLGKKRGKAVLAGQVSFFFRGPPELKAYVSAAAEDQQQEQGEFIIKTIELDRDLGEKLADDADRLTAFAESIGATLDDGMAEVLAQLVRRGLDALDAEQAAKHKPSKK